MRNVANKKAWMAMAALAAAVAMSPRAMAQSTYTWDSSGVNPSSPVDGSGNWDLSTPDWSNNAGDVVWPNDASVAAFGNGGTAGTVMVQTPVNAGSLLFNPVASGTYTIASTNAITLGGTAAIGVLSNANISAPLGGSLGLIVNGTSTLNLSGANTYTGATVLDSGTLQLGSATALPATTAITVNSGATLDVNGQTSTAASLAGAGNVLLESGSNLTLNSPVNTATVFSGTLTGSGTLTKVAAVPGSGQTAGTLTLTASSPAFTGTIDLNNNSSATNATNNGLILSGNANINNGSIVVNNTATTGNGPQLSLSNLATALTAPITFNLNSNAFRFTINAAAGTNEMISSNITANFSGSAPQLIFLSDTGGGNLAISSKVTVPSTATGGLIVFRGALSESFTGSITAPAAVAVATTNAGSCFFDPQPGSTWGATELMSTYTLEIPNDSALTDGTLSGATNSAEFFGGKLQLVNYTSNLNFVPANMSGTSALNLGAALGAPSTENGSINLTGTNVVNFVGPGTLIMNGSVTTGGAVNLTGGTLVLGNSNIFPSTSSPTVPAGATLDLNGQQLAVKAISGAGNVILTNGGELYLTASAGTLSGTISGTGDIYMQTGSITLSGNNTYSGGTTLGNSSGTLTLGSATGLGTGDLNLFGTLDLKGFSPTIGSLNGNGAALIKNSGTAGASNLTVGSDNNSNTFGGVINNTVGSLTVVGTGTLTLTNNNAYIGATNVNSGTLQIGTSNALPTTTALTVASGATLDMTGQSQQVASLAGAGSIVNTGALTIGGSASTTFSGTMSSGGSLTFASTASGTLTINSDDAVGGSSANVSFAAGSTAILKFANYTSNLSFNNSGNVILGASSGAASTLAGAVTGSGSLSYAGPGTLILSSTGNNYSGGTTITSGNLQFAAGAFPDGPITINSPGALDITGAFTTVASALPSIANSSTGAVALTADSSENIDFTSYSSLALGAQANSSYTGTITPGSNGYNLGGGGATLTLSNTNALTGGNSLNITGAGTVALTGINSFTGPVTLSAGTLSINSDVAINNGNVIFAGGTLQLNNYSSNLPAFSANGTSVVSISAMGTSTLNSAIPSTAGFTYQGPGTLLLGSNVVLSSTTPLVVNAGTLDLNGQSQTAASLAGAGTVNTESGVILSVGASSATAAATNSTFSGSITGAGGFAKNNGGTLTLTGTSNLTGPVSINQNSTTALTAITLSGANASINTASVLNMTNSVSPANANFVPTLNLSSLGSAVTLSINVTIGAGNRASIINTAGANSVTGNIAYASDTSATTFNFYSNAGTFTVSSDVTATGTHPGITFRGTGAGVEGIFNGTINGSGATNLTVGKTDPNTWVLNPTVGSTWQSETLAGGTWQMGRADVLPPTVLMPLSSGSTPVTLDLNGFDQTVGGLTSAAGSEFVTSNNGPATLTIAVPTGVSDAFGSASSDTIQGPLTITIAGPGTETFGNATTTPTVLNNANTYTGGTNLNGGTLIFNNTSTINNLGTGPISFNGGALTYNGTANSYDLTTNGLTINAGGATINTGANTVTFANAISGGGPLTKTGSGSLTLNAPVNFSALTASAGTAHLASGGNTIAGTLAISTSSTVQIDGNTTAGKLTGDGTGTLKITAGKVAATAQGQSTLALASLSIEPGAVLDLDNGNLAINYGTGTDPFATIVAYIKNGYDHGNWDGASPVNGTIISSASIGQATALGYADNTTSQQVQVKYTWYGDLDLNGVVNDADLMAMGTGTANTWATGDLNYDGVVNADDFALFMYGNASQNNSISAGVPEPAGMALLVVPVAAGLIRRRRAIPNRSQI